MSDKVRLSVNLAPSVAVILTDIAKRHRVSVTEALRRVIVLWKIVDNAIAQGNRVMVITNRGSREIILGENNDV